MRILLIEDDRTLSEGICEGLCGEGYAVDVLDAAESAELALRLTAYDLAIVDIGLPGMSGLELVRRLRQDGNDVAILILTARDGLDDRIQGLDLGADDYMVKPFHLTELYARIRVLLRRRNGARSAVLKLGQIRLDQSTHQASANDKPLELTQREWELLQQLMLCSPNVLSKKKLAESLSDWSNELTSNAVEIYISRLRSKIANCGVEIRTVRGIGYRLDES